MSEFKWYVVRVISGKEKKTKAYLENEIDRQHLEEYIPQILIPSEKVYEMRNGKKRVRERNFFPGYVLISADLSYGEAYHVITSVPGVIGFLGSGPSGPTREPVALLISLLRHAVHTRQVKSFVTRRSVLVDWNYA